MSTPRLMISPRLLNRAMKATGTRTPQAAIRAALLRTVEISELREMEQYPRLDVARRVKESVSKGVTMVRDRKHFRRLIGL